MLYGRTVCSTWPVVSGRGPPHRHPAGLGTDLLPSGDGVLREVKDDRGAPKCRKGSAMVAAVGSTSWRGNDDDRASIWGGLVPILGQRLEVVVGLPHGGQRHPVRPLPQ